MHSRYVLGLLFSLPYFACSPTDVTDPGEEVSAGSSSGDQTGGTQGTGGSSGSVATGGTGLGTGGTDGAATGGNGGSTTTGGSGGVSTGGSGGLVITGGTGGTGGSGETSDTVRFVALGDTGKGTPEQTQVGNAIAAKCARDGCDFVQLLGDNIYESGVASVTDPEWQPKFVQPYQAVDLPFWVVLGNHDYGGAGTGFELPRAQAEVDYTNTSDKWNLPSHYYRRTVGPAEFFALDTTPGMFNQHAQQETEVAGWIAQSTATWKITFGHHPYLSNGPHGNAGAYDGALGLLLGTAGAGVKDLLDSTMCGNVDVYLSGHDHSLQWLTDTCGGTELIVSGTGASPTTLPGVNPAHYQSVKLGFLYVVITETAFEGSFIDIDGNVEFTRTLTK